MFAMMYQLFLANYYKSMFLKVIENENPHIVLQSSLCNDDRKLLHHHYVYPRINSKFQLPFIKLFMLPLILHLFADAVYKLGKKSFYRPPAYC